MSVYYNEQMQKRLSSNGFILFFKISLKTLGVLCCLILVLFVVSSGIETDRNAYFERAKLFLSYRLKAIEDYGFQVLASSTLNKILSRYAQAKERYQITEWNTPFSEYLESLTGSDDFIYDAFFFPVPDTAKSALTMRENLSFSVKNILRSSNYVSALLQSKGKALWFATDKGLFLTRLIRNLEDGMPIGALCFVIDVPNIIESVQKGGDLYNLCVVQDSGTILFDLNEASKKAYRNTSSLRVPQGTYSVRQGLPRTIPCKEGFFFSTEYSGFVSNAALLTDVSSLYLVSIEHPLIGMFLSEYTFLICVCSMFPIGAFFTVVFYLKKRPKAGSVQSSHNTLPVNLSPQEYKICSLLVEGHTNKEIADKLNLKEQTIKNYLHRIYTKFGLSGRVAATLFIKDFFDEQRHL